MNLWGGGHPAADAQNPGSFCGRAGTLGAGRTGVEGEGLSHRGGSRGWGGRSRHPLRGLVMQMQTREGRAGWGLEGRRRSLGLGERACASKSLG